MPKNRGRSRNMTFNEAKKLYEQIKIAEKSYPDDHNQLPKIREQKKNLLKLWPDLKKHEIKKSLTPRTEF